MVVKVVGVVWSFSQSRAGDVESQVTRRKRRAEVCAWLERAAVNAGDGGRLAVGELLVDGPGTQDGSKRQEAVMRARRWLSSV